MLDERTGGRYGMGYRRFTDRDGSMWEVRDVSSGEWELIAVSGAGERTVRVRAPSYESDPFELSIEELQRMLDAERGGLGGAKKSPFLD
jgi:hypothetical protein